MPKQLLKKLINADSTKDTGELQAAQVLKNFFADHNINAQLDVWDQTRANITAHIKGQGSAPPLIFACHLDVVPPGDKPWQTPPFEATEKDGKIFGRGSCDMKIGTAAIAAAAAQLVDSGTQLKGDLIITATAGEETDSCGIIKFYENFKDKISTPAGIILPEPTNFEIVTGHRGVCWLKITTLGKTAHGSMPHLGINAISSMTKLLKELENFDFAAKDHPLFGKPSMSINQIHAGNATNVIPDSCFIELDIRITPNQNSKEIINKISDIIKTIKADNPDFDAKIEPLRIIDAINTDPDCDFVKNICSITDTDQTRVVGYTTDGPVLTKFGAPLIVFGPGDSALAHQPDEYVETKDLTTAVDTYKKIITNLLT